MRPLEASIGDTTIGPAFLGKFPNESAGHGFSRPGLACNFAAMPAPNRPRTLAEAEARMGTTPWPAVRQRSVEAIKWYVLIGYRLRQWRMRGNGGEPMKQVTVAMKTGMGTHTLSEIELGRQCADAVQIRALTTVYKKGPGDVAELFKPATAAEWAMVLREFVPDPRYQAPPGKTPLL